MFDFRSLIKIINIIVANTEPCGIRRVTCHDVECLLLITILFFFLYKTFFIHLRSFPLTHHTCSNFLSVHMILCQRPSWNPNIHYLPTYSSSYFYTLDLLSLNPNCLHDIMLCFSGSWTHCFLILFSNNLHIALVCYSAL